MDDRHRRFYKEIAQSLESALQWTVDSSSNPSWFIWDMTPQEEAKEAVRLLDISTPEKKSALRKLVREGMISLLHGVMTTLDGATELADHYTIQLLASDGAVLGPGLDELLLDYFYVSGPDNDVGPQP